MQPNKYGAKKAVVNDVKFDSQFEARVFETLIARYLNNEIYPHYSVPLLPPSCLYKQGKKWQVDFKVIPPYGANFYVEAKGIITRDLYWQLSVVETLRPTVFDSLLLVFPQNRCFEKNLVSKLRERTIRIMGREIRQVVTLPELQLFLQGNTQHGSSNYADRKQG